MALNLTTYESSLQTQLNASTSSTQPKDMFLLAKSIEASTGSVTVSNIQTEGATQVTNVQTEGATQTTNLQNASTVLSMKKAAVAMALIFG